jgi:GDP-L-fucose synthase
MSAGGVAFDLTGKRVFVSGHRGMAGSAIVRRLSTESSEVITVGSDELDLRQAEPTRQWLCEKRPDVVVVTAARVGGIVANSTYPVSFLADNLHIELNLIEGSYAGGIQKLLFVGSTCIYPKFAKQPISEDELLKGELEPTNEWYAIAKIAGIKLCQAHRLQYGADYISVMPTNLYGPGDNYHPEHSHVMAGLMRRIHEAKMAKAPSVVVWGTGTPRREFLHVDDFADAAVFLLKHYSDAEIVNIGVGQDLTIAELAGMIADVVGYEGELVFDTSRPDGTPRKLVDVSRLNALGWKAAIALRPGLEMTYRSFLLGHWRER